MTDTDVRAPLCATAATMTGGSAPPRKQAPRTLSPQALERASMPTAKPISPIVLAGTVRMAEFAIVIVIGMLIYTAYLPDGGAALWRYLGATFAIAILATLAFQAADIYQVQAFRGYEKQYMRLASAWSVVFLIVIGGPFFAKAGELFSRVWLGTFYLSGLATLTISRNLLFYLVRHWTREVEQ